NVRQFRRAPCGRFSESVPSGPRRLKPAATFVGLSVAQAKACGYIRGTFRSRRLKPAATFVGLSVAQATFVGLSVVAGFSLRFREQNLRRTPRPARRCAPRR